MAGIVSCQSIAPITQASQSTKLKKRNNWKGEIVFSGLKLIQQEAEQHDSRNCKIVLGNDFD
jgi:hypothetical protein